MDRLYNDNGERRGGYCQYYCPPLSRVSPSDLTHPPPCPVHISALHQVSALDKYILRVHLECWLYQKITPLMIYTKHHYFCLFTIRVCNAWVKYLSICPCRNYFYYNTMTIDNPHNIVTHTTRSRGRVTMDDTIYEIRSLTQLFV